MNEYDRSFRFTSDSTFNRGSRRGFNSLGRRSSRSLLDGNLALGCSRRCAEFKPSAFPPPVKASVRDRCLVSQGNVTFFYSAGGLEVLVSLTGGVVVVVVAAPVPVADTASTVLLAVSAPISVLVASVSACAVCSF